MTLYSKTFEKFNHNFISSSTLMLLAQSCLGGVASMIILSNGTSFLQMIQLGIVVLVCMSVNTGIIAQLNHKTIFNLLIASVFFSFLFITLNVI